MLSCPFSGQDQKPKHLKRYHERSFRRSCSVEWTFCWKVSTTSINFMGLKALELNWKLFESCESSSLIVSQDISIEKVLVNVVEQLKVFSEDILDKYLGPWH